MRRSLMMLILAASVPAAAIAQGAKPALYTDAQASAGAVIYVSTKYGYPLSTTHVISGSVLGAGATKRLSAVRWGVAGNIVAAWLLTIPAAGLVAAALYWPVQGIF